jgi:hypothetical protein
LDPNVKEKVKKTNMERRGVEYPTQSKDVKEKVKKTNIERRGVEYPTQSQDVREKVKKTNIERRGVEYPTQSQDVREKSKQTNLKIRGVENPSQSQEVKEKVKQTNLEKRGVEYSIQSDEIKEKIKKTCLMRYGFENIMHNPIMAEKVFKNRFKRKPFEFPSGKIVKVQGYEPFCLRDLLNQKIDENDIVTDIKLVPVVWWEDKENKKHRYYTDIYIKSQDKCIEVKSDYTFEKEKEEVFCKQKAVKQMGKECEIWIYNRKGELINKF